MSKSTKDERKQSYRLDLLTLGGVMLLLAPILIGATVAAFTDKTAFVMLSELIERTLTVAASLLAGYGLSRKR